MFREAVKKAVEKFEEEERFWMKIRTNVPDGAYKKANDWREHVFDTRCRSKHIQLREI